MILLSGLLILTITTASLNGFTLIESVPPPPGQVALMARYIIHNSDWVSISTISTIDSIKSYPFVNLKSMSDGPITKGTGVPYLYMTPADLSGKDVEKDNRCTISASLAQSDYCKSENYDQQDPRCARVILSGHLVKVDNTTTEYEFAKESLFSRHPAMAGWPTYHNWYVAKVDIELVAVLDNIGAGVVYVSVEDYFNAISNTVYEKFPFGDITIIDFTA